MLRDVARSGVDGHTDCMEPVLCPVILGRDAELAVLHAALTDAEAGRGGLVMLTADAGIGKSRLLREVTETAAASGDLAVTGRAVASGAATPFRPLSEAILQAIRAARLPDEQQNPWPAALRDVLPDPQPASAADRTAETPDISPIMRGEAILRLLRTLAGPAALLLGLEDLQWADPDTLAVVEYLADNIRAEHVLCVIDRPAGARLRRPSTSSRRSTPAAPPGSCRCPGCPTRTRARWCWPAVRRHLDAARHRGAPPMGCRSWLRRLLAAPGVPGLLRCCGGGQAGPARSGGAPGDPGRGRARAAVRLAAPAGRGRSRTADSGAGPRARGRPAAAHVSRRRLPVPARADPRGHHRWPAAACAGGTSAGRARRSPSEPVPRVRELTGTWLPTWPSRPETPNSPPGCSSIPAAIRCAAEHWPLPRPRFGAPRTWLATTVCGAPRNALLTEALALAGRVDECMTVSAAALRDSGASHARRASRDGQIHLAIAHAAVEATRWPVAADHLASAERLLAADPDPAATQRWRVLAAETALARRDLAGRPAARRAGPGSADGSRRRDGVMRSGWSGAAIGPATSTPPGWRSRRRWPCAEMANLPLWRLRALHELGTIELFEQAGTDRLEQARQTADDLGALSTAAVLDIQLAAAYLFRFDPEPGSGTLPQPSPRRNVFTSPRFSATARVFLAELAGLRRDAEAMERSQ